MSFLVSKATQYNLIAVPYRHFGFRFYFDTVQKCAKFRGPILIAIGNGEDIFPAEYRGVIAFHIVILVRNL